MDVRRTFLCCCVLGVASICSADGFFRRLPEVGEWARYELAMEVASTQKEDSLDFLGVEYVGSLTLKCVGEETIEEVEHLWLEARINVTDPEGAEEWTAIKVLVPADQIVEGKINGHIVRGWCAGDSEEPRALILNDGKLDQETSAFALMNAFPDCHISAGRREVHTVTLAGEEIELAHCEIGDMPEFESDGAEMVGEATWWPSADHAFGIAAAELEWTAASPDQPESFLFTSRMSLVEYGTDAESDLPEHN